MTFSRAIGLCVSAFMVLLSLRLLDRIDVAWYWIVAPLLIIPAMLLSVFLICVLAFDAGGLRRLREHLEDEFRRYPEHEEHEDDQ